MWHTKMGTLLKKQTWEPEKGCLFAVRLAGYVLFLRVPFFGFFNVKPTAPMFETSANLGCRAAEIRSLARCFGGFLSEVG